MLEIFYYCVYGIVGIFVLRFIFWEIPLHFQRYWVGVLSSAAAVAVLIGVGFLTQKNGIAAFIVGAVALVVFARLAPFLIEWTGIKKK
jgi:hypothetical protein